MKNIVYAVIAMLAIAMSPQLLRALEIYSDDFSGDTSDLHGTTPDVGAANWAAHSAFNADGAVDFVANGTGAWLPFTPESQKIYTLSASFRGVSGNANWFATGFAEAVPANPENVGNDYRFISGTSVGKAWLLFRGTNAVNPNQSLRGDADSGTAAAGTLSWDGGPTEGGDVDVQIVLNTLGGPGAFNATFFAKRPGDAAYAQISDAGLPLLAEDIGAVGFAYSNTGITGSIDSFSLSVVPEPTSLVLIITSLGTVALARRRRLS